MQNRVALITANFGGFDNIQRIAPQDVRTDCFFFTDGAGQRMASQKQFAEASSAWQIIAPPYPRYDLNPRLKAKYFKLQQHRIAELKGYDYYIWIDASVEVYSGSFSGWIIDSLGDADTAFFRHHERSCIYNEAAVSTDFSNPYIRKRYADEPITEQIAAYRQDAYPSGNGLYACTIFARRNSKTANAVFDEWWLENIKWSFQDQLSLPYVLHRNNSVPAILQGTVNENGHTRFGTHFADQSRFRRLRRGIKAKLQNLFRSL